MYVRPYSAHPCPAAPDGVTASQCPIINFYCYWKAVSRLKIPSQLQPHEQLSVEWIGKLMYPTRPYRQHLIFLLLSNHIQPPCPATIIFFNNL